MAVRLDSIDLLNAINQDNVYARISGWGNLINPVLQDKFTRYCMAKKSLSYVFIIKIILTGWAFMDAYISLEVYGYTPFQIFFTSLSLLFLTISWITAIILEYFMKSKELIFSDWHPLIQAIFIFSINATIGVKFLKYIIYTPPLPDNIQVSEGALNFISLHTASGFAVSPVIMMAIIYEPRFFLSAFCTTFITLGLALAGGISAPAVFSGLIRLTMLLILFHQIQNQRLVAFVNNIMLLEMLEEREKNADAVHALEMRHMIGNVAHDLKTPLSAFMNGIDMMRSVVNQTSKKLLSGKFTSEEVTESCHMMHDALNNIYNANTFMLMEINRCVDYTKAIKGIKLIPKFEVTDMREVMKYCADVVMCIQERIRVISSDLGKEINPFVRTDKQWLQENILCLLSNAVKYASTGPVSLRVTLVEDRPFKSAVDLSMTCEEPGIQTPSSQKTFSFSRDSFDGDTGKNLLIEVEDDGPGIDESVLQNIFTPFKQAKRLVGGTGLGLFSLAKRIESLTTSYGVKNRENGEHGSIFWFTIPYSPDSESLEKELASPVDPTTIQKESDCLPPPPSPQNIPQSIENSPVSVQGAPVSNLPMKQPPPPSSPYSAYSVLVVDDSPTIVKLCSMTLKKLGFVVATAENGAVAVTKVEEKIKKTGKEFDLILMDIQMPVMDGLEATKKIRALEKAEKIPLSDGVTESTKSVSPPEAVETDTSQNVNSNPTHQLIFGVSANSDQETIQEAFEAGVDDFLGKPFTMDALSSAFMKHLKEMTERNQLNISGKTNENVPRSPELLQSKKL